jgi:competence ComEA-like helix-hairpin-helix protein
MTPASPQLGVAPLSPPAPSSAPLGLPTSVPAPEPTPSVRAAWPLSAQVATGILLLLAVGLLAWNVYGRGRWATRPTALESGNGDVFRIDLNRADRAQFLQLPGAGENLVSRIEAYRREHGGFHDVDELRRVSGIGPVLLERWRPLVYVSVADGDEEPGAEGTAPPPRVVRAARPEEAPIVRTGTKSPLAPGETIDVNRASLTELQRLPSVGPALAARIVEARARKPFGTVEDLRHVSGIGAKTLDKLRPHIRVE